MDRCRTNEGKWGGVPVCSVSLCDGVRTALCRDRGGSQHTVKLSPGSPASFSSSDDRVPFTYFLSGMKLKRTSNPSRSLVSFAFFAASSTSVFYFPSSISFTPSAVSSVGSWGSSGGLSTYCWICRTPAEGIPVPCL